MKTIIGILGIVIIIIVIAVGVWSIIYILAPIGYEDENGFHYGDRPEEK